MLHMKTTSVPDQPTLYTYTSRNLLDDPEYYMYSAYSGRGFLRQYASLRHRVAVELENRYIAHLHSHPVGAVASDIPRLLSEWGPLLDVVGGAFCSEVQTIHNAYSRDDRFEDTPVETSDVSVTGLDTLPEIPTRQALRSLLLAVVRRDASPERKLKEWLSRFLTRFEVTKRLYTVYTPTMKRAGRDFHLLTNYALLSLSLVLFYEQTDDLKMLNGALKLNDLLCSAEENINGTEDSLLTISALRKEMENVNRLTSTQGITL